MTDTSTLTSGRSAAKSHERPARQTRQQRRYSKTRNKLVTSARAVFAERGLDLATVDDITERADLGRGTFYYHFGSKEELIRQLIREILAELTNLIKAECEGKEELSSLLDAVIAAHIHFFSNRWEDFVLYFQGRADLTLDRSYEGIETPFLDYIKCIEELVDGAIAQPIPSSRLHRLACAIAGFISGYYSFASIATDNEDVDKSFLALRSAFVASLTRFVTEAVPVK